jgi:hypothetical protein
MPNVKTVDFNELSKYSASFRVRIAQMGLYQMMIQIIQHMKKANYIIQLKWVSPNEGVFQMAPKSSDSP